MKKFMIKLEGVSTFLFDSQIKLNREDLYEPPAFDPLLKHNEIMKKMKQEAMQELKEGKMIR
jgi:hypothetical protein